MCPVRPSRARLADVMEKQHKSTSHWCWCRNFLSSNHFTCLAMAERQQHTWLKDLQLSVFHSHPQCALCSTLCLEEKLISHAELTRWAASRWALCLTKNITIVAVSFWMYLTNHTRRCSCLLQCVCGWSVLSMIMHNGSVWYLGHCYRLIYIDVDEAICPFILSVFLHVFWKLTEDQYLR